MDEAHIIESLITGNSLATVMMPDVAIPSNKPKHLEGFLLPHVLIRNNEFWGFTRCVHNAHTLGGHVMKDPTVFAYGNNIEKTFISFTYGSEKMNWMPLIRYESHEFIIKEDYERLVV